MWHRSYFCLILQLSHYIVHMLPVDGHFFMLVISRVLLYDCRTFNNKAYTALNAEGHIYCRGSCGRPFRRFIILVCKEIAKGWLCWYLVLLITIVTITSHIIYDLNVTATRLFVSSSNTNDDICHQHLVLLSIFVNKTNGNPALILTYYWHERIVLIVAFENGFHKIERCNNLFVK